MEPEIGDTIAVWFSCGAASAVAAKLAIERYPLCWVRVLNNPVAEEDEDNLRFRADVEQWLDHPIETVTNPDYPDCSATTVWNHRQYMAGNAGAPCTIELKKKARQRWERENPWDHCVLGFTTDEAKRHERFVLTERALLPVLIDAGMTKQDCIDYLLAEDIQPPRMYRLGYPNANCIGCVKATSPTYWNHVRHVHPEVFQARAEQSHQIGARLVRYKGERIFLDELPVDAQGAPLKTLDIDCGSFCEQ